MIRNIVLETTRQSKENDNPLFHPCLVTERKSWIEIQHDEQSPIFTFKPGEVVWVENGQFSFEDGKILYADIERQQIHIEEDAFTVCVCDVVWDEDEHPVFKAKVFIQQ